MEDKDELYDPEIATKPDSQNGRRDSPRRRSRSPVRRSRSRSRSPRNWRRGERDHRRSRDTDTRRPLREGPGGKVRLYVCNMPYDVKWQDLKDTFKREVGAAVTYVELYESPDGKPSGAGAVEVKGADNAEKAIAKMNRYELNGRKIIVREERDKDRLRFRSMGGAGPGGGMGMGGGMGSAGGNMGMVGGNSMGGSSGGLMGNPVSGLMGSGDMIGGGGMSMGAGSGGGSPSNHGINPQLLQQLGIEPNHVTNQVFAANLDYTVNEKKIREIFKMAGTIVDVDLKTDKDGKSRGFCIIRFEHPVEAIQAISMFHSQVLYDRVMTVKMDKMGDNQMSQQQIPSKLPSGLKSIGMGLGSGGTPVNVLQLQTNNMIGSGIGGMNTGMGMGNVGNMGMGGGNMSGMGGGVGMGTGLGSGGSLGGGINSPTGMGASNMGNMGMGGGSGSMGGTGGSMGMSMNSMGGTGLGSMGNDLTGGTMGLRSSMGGQSSLGGMGMSDMGSSLSLNTGMGMGSMGGSMNSLGGGGTSSMSGGMGRNSGLGGSGGMDRYGGRDSKRDGNQESTTIFVRNIPFAYGWQDLKNKFSSCGHVLFAEVKIENGKSKGYGTVKFTSSEDARRAVNLMNGARVDGRSIEVKLNRN